MVTAHWGQKYLKPACEATGVPRFTPYALRRLSIQLDARNGINMGLSAKRHGNSVAVIAKHYQQFNDEDERQAFEQTSGSRRRRVLPYREQRAVGGGPVQIQNKDKKQGQNDPHEPKTPLVPSDIEGYMGLPRDVERVLERRGKPCFFEIKQGQKAQNSGPARTKARTKMWETVAGLVVEADTPKIRVPEGVEFVGNWGCGRVC